MCGITGFWDLRGCNNDYEFIISSMTNKLFHRGPDDGDIWVDSNNRVALGHRRLAIIDLSPLGHQPMHSRCERYVIVYNGEVYNYLQLKKALEAKGHQFRGHADTEVVLELISEYGLEKSLKMLNGMFAFALWDKQAKTLYLARDRLGEKPLYYGKVNGTFVFSSELKALEVFPNFSKTINRNALTSLLQYTYIPAPSSIYENIFKLKPATYLSIAEADLDNLPDPQFYWNADQIAIDGLSNPLSLSDSEAVDAIDMMLKATIKNRMISDVPVGSFLSGGIDSSTVTALMQANSDMPIKTFTIGFNEVGYNEAEHAKLIAQHLKTDHTELYVESSQALSLIPRLPEIYDEPFADASAIPTFLVSQITKRFVTVCLSGDGGDEVFGGYNRYLIGSTLWKKLTYLPYPFRKIIKKMLVSISPEHWDKILGIVKQRLLGEKLHKLASIIDLKTPADVYQRLISQWPDPNDLVINANYQQIKLKEFSQLDFVENMMLTDAISYLPDDIMVKVDRAGMAVSLENRAPYLDHELIEWMWHLPLHMKIRNGETKWLLRRVLEKHVPKYLFDRPKMGFGVPLGTWLRGPLKNWASELLDQSLLNQQGFFNSEPIIQKWRQHLLGKYNYQYQLWPILMFQAWLNNKGFIR